MSPCLSTGYVGVALAGAEYSQSRMSWMNWSLCRTVAQETILSPFINGEPWCCLNTDSKVRDERQWWCVGIAHFHHFHPSVPRLAWELCREPRHRSAGKPSLGQSVITHPSPRCSPSPGVWGLCWGSRSLSQTGAGGACSGAGQQCRRCLQWCSSLSLATAQSSQEDNTAALESVCKR